MNVRFKLRVPIKFNFDFDSTLVAVNPKGIFCELMSTIMRKNKSVFCLSEGTEPILTIL